MTQYNREFFIEQIKRVVPNAKVQGKRMFICCPFHKDDTPSFKINLDEHNRRAALGSCFCFGGCGSKSWNEVAEKLGMQQIGRKNKGMESVGVGYVMRASDDDKKALLGESQGVTWESIVETYSRMSQHHEIIYVDEVDEDWRGIKLKLLQKIGCKITLDVSGMKSILFPVMVNEIRYGAIKGLWTVPKPTIDENGKKKKALKYINLPGEWIKNYGLFPYDTVEEMNRKLGGDYVILVEGQRDALNLISKGYPAIAILGTNNWSAVKRNTLLGMGVERVVIFMDSDSAGIKAHKMIAESLKGYIEVVGIRTKDYQEDYEKLVDITKTEEDKLDPGNCPPALLKQIMRDYDVEPLFTRQRYKQSAV